MTGRVQAYCLGLDLFPQRGTARPDIRPNLRLLGFEKWATIAFEVEGDVVRIIGVFAGGRDVEAALGAAAPGDQP